MKYTHEIRYKGDLWRIEASDFGGKRSVVICPHYLAADGNYKHGKGGLRFPIEEAETVAEAILAAAAQLR